jgi:hypothetical protein
MELLMQPNGIDLTLGTGPTGLWFNDEASSGMDLDAWGIRFGLRWGRTIFQFPQFLKARWWKGELPVEPANWYEWRLPFFICPFVSILGGRWFNCYLGVKYNGWLVDDWLLMSATFRVPAMR